MDDSCVDEGDIAFLILRKPVRFCYNWRGIKLLTYIFFFFKKANLSYFYTIKV